MSRFKRSTAGAAALALGASLMTLGTPAALSAPKGPETPIVGQAKGEQPQAVTLINGDTIRITTSTDGKPSALLPAGRDYFSRIDNEDLYVIPVDAQELIASGQLDVELFNVTSLLKQGYGDADSDSIPLIMQGRTSVFSRTAGLDVAATLDSINATAVSMDKETAAKAYQQLLGPKARNAKAGAPVKKIWLDARVAPSSVPLDPATGVEQTGADEVWDLGFDGKGTKVAVLDTGVDAEHPDLKGQISESKNFTDEDARDYIGHGTHVASTIAGSGAADASKKGMAPETDLLIGKVLGNYGGQTSWIIAGMEWAVAEGADVVNMSLGSSQPTDCTDPMSLAGEELAAQSKTLFVVAAGNLGAGRETVSSPGCAEGVLTVGAVDSESNIAAFSSRGSTLGAHNLKPDLSAPGVAIAGAQAGSEGYLKMSGTSMATPHVVGAAALVRQAHPEYTAQQLKAALTSSVKEETDSGVYLEGAGELWTPAAVATTLTSDPSVELGSFDWPHSKQQTKTTDITYTNTSDKPIKMTLKVEDLVGADGGEMPGNLIKLGKHQVTVPAKGSIKVPVTASGNVKDLRTDAYGEIGARIVADEVGSGTAHAVTAVGFWLEPKTVNVTFKNIDREGAEAAVGYMDLVDMHQPSRIQSYFTGEETTLQLRAGDYSVTSIIGTRSDTVDNSFAMMGNPELSLEEDTTIVFDAREASEITLKGDRPLEVRSGTLATDRTWDDAWQVSNSVTSTNITHLYVQPTNKVERGTFDFASALRAYDPAQPEATSSYVYNLAFFEKDHISAQQHHDVPDSSLGTVDETWYAQGAKPWNAQEWTRVMPLEAGDTSLFTAVGSRISTPTQRTSYYTADLPWQQLAQSGQIFDFPEVWYDPVHTFSAGEQLETNWFKLPTNTGMALNEDGTVARIGERQERLIGFAFPQWKDSEGRMGDAGFSDIGNLTVFENGKSLGRSSFPSGQFHLSMDESTIEAKLEQRRFRRSGFWDLGLRTLTTFTFGLKAPQGDEVQVLPMALPMLDAEVDGFNRAPSQQDFPVSVSLLGQDGYNPGGIKSLSAQVDYTKHSTQDDPAAADYQWVDAQVVEDEDGYKVLVDNTAAVNGLVSLHLVIEDANGSKTDQIIENFYGVNR